MMMRIMKGTGKTFPPSQHPKEVTNPCRNYQENCLRPTCWIIRIRSGWRFQILLLRDLTRMQVLDPTVRSC
ncbi:hypothetical protein I311_06502 [Cryptococcus gattii NT-10]|nr:hypothetical protein I311_06502 [Cryptococcus gattii NT-10]